MVTIPPMTASDRRLAHLAAAFARGIPYRSVEPHRRIEFKADGLFARLVEHNAPDADRLHGLLVHLGHMEPGTGKARVRHWLDEPIPEDVLAARFRAWTARRVRWGFPAPALLCDRR